MNRVILIALVVLSVFTAFCVRSGEAQDINAKLKSLKSELTTTGMRKIQEVKHEVVESEDAHRPVEQQIKLLANLAQLQSSFDLTDEAKSTNIRLIALLRNAKCDPSLLIQINLRNLGFSRGHYQTNEQEEACLRTLKELYTDVAKQDPCLQAQVLSRWISWYPSELKVRTALVEALNKCAATDKKTMAMKANAYLWASGYQPTNHTLYIAPRSPQLLRRSFECAVAGDEVDILFRTRKLMIFNKTAETSEPGTETTFGEKGEEKFLKFFSVLATSSGKPTSQSFVSSNLVRNEMTELFGSGTPGDVIAVVQSWRNLLQKVPSQPYNFPHDSEYELALSSVLLGASYAELQEYDKAKAELTNAAAIAEKMKAEGQNPFDWDALRKHCVLSMDDYLKDPSDNKQYNPLEDLGDSFGFSINRRISGADDVNRAVLLNDVIIRAKQNNLLDAERLFLDLEKAKQGVSEPQPKQASVQGSKEELDA